MSWLLLWACTCAPVRSAPVEEPPPWTGPETIRDVIGINEALGIPRRRVGEMSEKERAEHLRDRIARVRELGVRHVRLHSDSYPFLNQLEHDQRDADEVIAEVLEAGLVPLVMLGPWPGNGPATHTDHYLPDDREQWLAWVRQVVERYDGDGSEDAPGLRGGVHLWEVDNEPDLHHLVAPRDRQGFDPSGFCTPEDYASLLVQTAAAIRESDPEATVLPGGLFSVERPGHAAYARALREQPGVDAFPLNVHSYPQGPRHDPLTVSTATPGTPLWITEVSVPSLGGPYTERTQAKALAELVLGALRRGVSRVYWHALVEAPTVYGPGRQLAKGRHLYIGNPEDVVGRPPRWREVHPKLAAWTLRWILERWGDVPRSEIQAIPHGLRIGGDLVIFGVEGPVRLPLEGRRAEVIEVVPTAGSRPSETPPQWTIRSERISRGQLTVDPRDGPLVVVEAR